MKTIALLNRLKIDTYLETHMNIIPKPVFLITSIRLLPATFIL